MALTSRFEEALTFATQLHAKQLRKGTTIPYVAHLLAVTALVLENGGDEDEAIAALLHDAIEDQGGAATREAIRRRFGERVVAIVHGCTDTDVTPKPPWRARKEAYIEHLRHASPSERLVALAAKSGEPPMTPEEEDLTLSQLVTLGMIETSQPIGDVFMQPRRPPREEP